ncbi:MAG: hypothetical protein CMJ19_21555 [Phycisphaeraceae bacterium]|nr:hypothetical protein [Phycisphaeraceae bacterium]
MQLDQDPLWQAINAFEFDAIDSSYPFTRRLASENRWSQAYAVRVVQEYRRFVYLGMRAGHPVTPSDQVDQAWHLHLLYTRSYWEEFCPNVLGRPFHHGPTQGGHKEVAKHTDWYTRTLQSYKQHFGIAPIADIWPPVENRFGYAEHGVRVFPSKSMILPRPWFLKRSRWFTLIPLTLAISSTQAHAQSGWPLDLHGPAFLKLYVLLMGIVALFCLLTRWVARHVPEPPSMIGKEHELDAYEVAYLAGGPKRVVLTAMARLHELEYLKVEHGQIKLDYKQAHFANDVERVILSMLRLGSSYKEIVKACKTATHEIAQRLADRGLALSGWRKHGTILLNQLLIIALLGLDVTKVVIGLSRDKPVLLLVALIVLTLFYFKLFCRTQWRSVRGKKLVKQFKPPAVPPERGYDDFSEKTHDDRNERAYAAAMACALLGPVALTACLSDLHPIIGGKEGARGWFDNWVSTGSGCSSGCASGCGGGGCGGGCGGCGGCGD